MFQPSSLYRTVPNLAVPRPIKPNRTLPNHSLCDWRGGYVSPHPFMPYLTVPNRTKPHHTIPYRTVPYRTQPYRVVLCF